MKYTLRIIAILSLLLTFACKKEIITDPIVKNSKLLSTAELREVMEINSGQSIKNYSTNSIQRNANWLGTYSLKLKNGGNILSVPLSENGDDLFNRAQSRLVAYKDSLGQIQKSIMVVRPDETYLKAVHNRVTLKTFTGNILFYSIDNTFSHGFVLENGKMIGQMNIVKAATITTNQNQQKTFGWTEDCEWRKIGYYMDGGELNIYFAKFCMWKYTESYIPDQHEIDFIAPEPENGGYIWEQKETKFFNITDSLDNFPCAKGLLTNLTSLKNDIATLMNQTFASNADFNIRFVPFNYGAGSPTDGDFIPNSIIPKNGYNYNAGFIYNGTIRLNEDVMTYASKEYILATMYHEALHAYISLEKSRLSPAEFGTKYPSINTAFVYGAGNGFDFSKAIFLDKHSVMGIHFSNQLISAIKSYNPALSDSTVTAIATTGIFHQSNNLKLLNKNERDTRDSLSLGTKCP